MRDTNWRARAPYGMSSKPTSFERYVPQRELPEEIQQLPLEETRCQFCGVSYLVHHEVKRLEGILQDLTTQLDTVVKEREKLLDSIKIESERIEELETEKEAMKEKYSYNRLV